jgi:hypothetical protein
VGYSENNEITGNLFPELMAAFADVTRLRERHLKDCEEEIRSTHKINRIISEKGKILLEKDAKFNTNKKMSCISCWRNQLIYKSGAGTYETMKKHFKKLSFFEF